MQLYSLGGLELISADDSSHLHQDAAALQRRCELTATRVGGATVTPDVTFASRSFASPDSCSNAFLPLVSPCSFGGTGGLLQYQPAGLPCFLPAPCVYADSAEQ